MFTSRKMELFCIVYVENEFEKFQFNDYLVLLNDIQGGFKIKRFIEIVLIVCYLAIMKLKD